MRCLSVHETIGSFFVGKFVGKFSWVLHTLEIDRCLLIRESIKPKRKKMPEIRFTLLMKSKLPPTHMHTWSVFHKVFSWALFDISVIWFILVKCARQMCHNLCLFNQNSVANAPFGISSLFSSDLFTRIAHGLFHNILTDAAAAPPFFDFLIQID